MKVKKIEREVLKEFEKEFSLPPEITSPTAGIGYKPKRRWIVPDEKRIQSFILSSFRQAIKKVVKSVPVKEKPEIKAIHT